MSKQKNVTPFRGMPVETMDDSQRVEDMSAETVQLYYFNSGTLTADAGQAAGTVVVGKLEQGSILSELGDTLAFSGNTSLSFTSTALTTEVEFNYGYYAMDDTSLEARLDEITANMENGQFCVDYSHGVIYGKKASTTTTLASTAYKIPVKGGSANVTLGKVITDFQTVNGNTINTTGGNRDTGTITVSLADNDPAVTALQGATPAGTNDIGKVGVTSSSNSFSTGLEDSHVASSSAATFKGAYGRIDSTIATATYYILVIDAASLPANGAVAELIRPLKIVHTNGTDSTFNLNYQNTPQDASNGVVVACSSTEFTLTVTALSAMSIEVLLD